MRGKCVLRRWLQRCCWCCRRRLRWDSGTAASARLNRAPRSRGVTAMVALGIAEAIAVRIIEIRIMGTVDTRTAEARIRASANGSRTGRRSSGGRSRAGKDIQAPGGSRLREDIRDSGVIRAIQQLIAQGDPRATRDARRLRRVTRELGSVSHIGRHIPPARIRTRAEAHRRVSLTTTPDRTGRVIFHNG